MTRSTTTIAITAGLMIVTIASIAAAIGSGSPQDQQKQDSPPVTKPPVQKPPVQKPPVQPLDMIKLEGTYDDLLLPVFEDFCAECHDTGEPERELSLMEFQAFLKGSVNGPIIDPGKPEESKLFQVVQEGSDPHMPPDGQLDEGDLERIKKWISELPPALKEKLGEKKDGDAGK